MNDQEWQIEFDERERQHQQEREYSRVTQKMMLAAIILQIIALILGGISVFIK